MNNLDKIYTSDIKKFATEYFRYLNQIIEGINTSEIENFVHCLLDARKNSAQIFFVGNGGSASTASHFANDIGIGTNSIDKPFKCISLTDNNAVITAISNDFGYDKIFQRQLQMVGTAGDVLVSISASGNSKNLIEAMKQAELMNIKTVAITSFDGGAMKDMADLSVHIPTLKGEYGPAEDSHMILDHLVGAYLIRLVQNA